MESLSDNERAFLLDAFNQIDTDRTGAIDKHELGAFLSLRWKHAVPNETVDSILTIVDENGDGKIQFDEFVMLQMKLVPSCRGYCKDCKKILIGMWTNCTKPLIQIASESLSEHLLISAYSLFLQFHALLSQCPGYMIVCFDCNLQVTSYAAHCAFITNVATLTPLKLETCPSQVMMDTHAQNA